MSSFPPQIEELVENLFENNTFLSKLRTFVEIDNNDMFLNKQSKSTKTDISSEKLQQSQSKSVFENQMLMTEIEDLLCELYMKNINCGRVGLPQFEICRIQNQIDAIKKQLESVRIKECHNSQMIIKALELGQDTHGKFVTIQQHKNWEQQILQKLNITVKRNFNKAESVFADKLNTFQMNIASKLNSSIEKQAKNPESENKKQLKQHPKPKEQQSNKKPHEQRCQKTQKEEIQSSHQSELVKKLKTAKSLGSLFGFKN